MPEEYTVKHDGHSANVPQWIYEMLIDMGECQRKAIARYQRAETEVARLRKLCAERPMLHVPSQERDEWRDKIDAAGKGA